MTTHIALLRAINVAGHQPVSMADLRPFATDLGLCNVRTLLQSGNLVFDTSKSNPGRLVVLFTQEPVARFDWSGPEIVKPDGRQVYVIYPNGQDQSRLKLPRGTARNWNTVLKLQSNARVAP